MRTLLALLIASLPLAGCVAVPVEGPPVVYAAPPPPVVVVPHYRHHHYYGGGRYWRRWR